MEQGSFTGASRLGAQAQVIHLDTNFLIGSVNRNSSSAGLLKRWLQHGETFAASSVAWAEFLHGPVRPDQIEQAEHLIEGNIITFGRYEAELSSRLFNLGGRRRGSQSDCFIAATAIRAGVKLATENQKHFVAFAPVGLRLV
jgi:predicted nucleic acid-binding protein